MSDLNVDVVHPRLLDEDNANKYLGGISYVRNLVAQGLLVPVRLPSARRPNEAGRRLLFDVRDLDALIDKSKTAAKNTQLSRASVKGWAEKPVRVKSGRAQEARQ